MESLALNKIKTVSLAGIGAACCIAVLAYLSQTSPLGALIMAPFGATMVIVFALPDSPLAQPRNVFFGHVLAAFIGLVVLHGLGVSSLTLGLGVGLAVAVMMLTDCVHPPAGANPLLIMLTAQSWDFLLRPVMIGAVLIIVFALIYHRWVTGKAYPKRWI